MANILVIAPHPDDETLGCGGTILKHTAAGDAVHWCIVTQMDAAYAKAQRDKREKEIESVAKAYKFAKTHQLSFAPAHLDVVPKSEMVAAMRDVFQDVKPDIVYLPFPGDIHSDHAAVFEAASANLKWFRLKSIKRALCYETVSETDFQIHPLQKRFEPTVFVNIDSYLDRKIEIMKIFESEIQEFPFPRSEEALRSLAQLRGAACGAKAAEAFVLLKEYVE